MVDLSHIKSRFEELKAEQRSFEKTLEDLDLKCENLEERLKDAEKALIIIQTVAQKTQKNLEFHFSNLVTSAIKSVKQDWPEFEIEFVVRRNRTECDIFFNEFGQRQHPMNSSGGGPKDIASFASRCAYWALKKNRPFMMLDQPFSNVSSDLHSVTSEMVKKLSDSLSLQILMVSHEEDINIAADKTFYVKRVGKVSQVKEE